MMEKQEISIAMPEVNSLKYKANVRQIEQSVRSLNNFTVNLEDKVNTMLKGQQTEFVNSYRVHMNTIEKALKDYQITIADYQKKVQYYENQGVLATLLNKINFLETHQKKLLNIIDKKDHIISTLKCQIQTQNNQILHLQNRIKQLLKSNVVSVPKLNHLRSEKQKQSQPTFSTEIQHLDKSTLRSNQSLEQITSPSLKNKYQTLVNPQNHNTYEYKIGDEVKRAKRQVEILKLKNRQLSSVNSSIIEKTGQVSQFFAKTINQLKKKISVRKNFTHCSFQDFKQEDKLQLLVKVLSNEQVLTHLYEKIFKKTNYSSILGLPKEQVSGQSLNNKTDRISGNKLPLISSFRRS